jgi:hypothetical protein
MSLESAPHDQIPDRCEECGAKLTPAEQQAVLELGGPALCAVHTAEDEPALAIEDEEDETSDE